jgi:hypothetical protein
MKLETLLKQITLPIHPELDPETDRPRLGSTGYAIHRDSEVIADGIPTPELAQYLCHAANVLPELVAAARNLQQNWEKNLTDPMARLNAALARAENVGQPETTARPDKATKAGLKQMARTTRETVHGNPGERRLLPANTLVVIEPASNLPPDSAIKYWAYPVNGHPWPADTEAWAEDVGVGLYAADVALVKMPACTA